MTNKLFTTLTILLLAAISSYGQERTIAFNFRGTDFHSLPASVPTDINTRVVDRFRREFGIVRNESWEQVSNGYVVRFTEKGIENWAFLNKRGNCEGRMKYYDEKQLMNNVRQQVKTVYYDYSIRSVKEITFNNETAYLVSIEGERDWKVIQVVAGELAEVEKHLK
jgi:hypothetical protein